MPSSGEMTCRELTSALTAYFEGALAEPDRDRFDLHCRGCARCRARVMDWQAMIRSLSRLEGGPRGATRPAKRRLVTLFREHGFHRPGRRVPRIPLGFDDELAAPGDHIACFWESERDFTATVGFVAAGAAQGETCILLGHDDANARLEAAIRRAGLGAAALRRQERLRVVSGMSSADTLIEEITERVRSAVDRGVPLVRILGNLGWHRPGWPADRELLRLEACVTDAVRRLPVIVVCAYDVRGVLARNLLLGGLECHPLTYRRQTLQQNPLYVPARRFLAALPREERDGAR